MYDDGLVAYLTSYSMISSLLTLLGPVIFVLLILWAVKKSRAQVHAMLRLYAGSPPVVDDIERLLQALVLAQGNIPAQRAQLTAAFLKAQNELGQMDALRRQQLDVRLGEIRGKAASLGISLD
jgi:hypothetical protein